MSIGENSIADFAIADFGEITVRLVLVPASMSSATAIAALHIRQPLYIEAMVSETTLSALHLLSPAMARKGWKVLVFISGEPKPAISLEPKPPIFDAQEF